MSRDGYPNAQFPVKRRPKYIAIAEIEAKHAFADALADAERIVKAQPGIKAHIYRIDSTVEMVNGILCVRNRQ